MIFCISKSLKRGIYLKSDIISEFYGLNDNFGNTNKEYALHYWLYPCKFFT